MTFSSDAMGQQMDGLREEAFGLLLTSLAGYEIGTPSDYDLLGPCSWMKRNPAVYKYVDGSLGLLRGVLDVMAVLRRITSSGEAHTALTEGDLRLTSSSRRTMSTNRPVFGDGSAPMVQCFHEHVSQLVRSDCVGPPHETETGHHSSPRPDRPGGLVSI